MQTNDLNEALTYVRAVPNVAALKNAYDTTINDLDWYLQSTRDSYDYRRNIWPGKSKDLRKFEAECKSFERIETMVDQEATAAL